MIKFAEMRGILCYLSMLVGLFGAIDLKAQPFQFKQNSWVDSVYLTLTKQEKIGQLMMVAAYSNPAQYNLNELKSLVVNYKIGGLIFFKGSPMRQANMFNHLQALAKVPLWVGMDVEWGLNMRLDSTLKFPRQMALAAFDDDSLVYDLGRVMAQQCKRMGVHISFSPVADVNNNPNNPVINDRSWGENREVVARKSAAYMHGLQHHGVMACIKHFPGHGDTEVDSHHDLPIIAGNRKRLDSLELYPFKQLINQGAQSVMAAHLFVPALDSTPMLASSLSPLILKQLLVDTLGFRGLLFTDALNMKGVSKDYKKGDLEVKALMAGNEVLLFPENIPQAIQKILLALDSNLIDTLWFEQAVKRVLAAKYLTGAWKGNHIDTNNLYSDLNHNREALLLREKASEQQLTLVKSSKRALPLQSAKKKIAVVSIGDQMWNPFHKAMNQYGRYDFFAINRDAPAIAFEALLEYLKEEDFDEFVVSLHNTNRLKSKMYGLTKSGVELIRALAKEKELFLVSFGIPYNLQYFNEVSNVLVAYQDIDLNMEKAAMALHGLIPLKGKLPVTVNEKWQAGMGILTPATSEALPQVLPEVMGLNSSQFNRIDSVVEVGLKANAFPGCQVLIAKDGKVVYQKAFGFTDYDKSTPVGIHHLYDYASITKVASTTLLMMKLYDEGKIQLDKKISYYLKDVKKSNKADITIRQLLTHTGGLVAWIPFYEKTLDSAHFNWYYSNCKSKDYPYQVANYLFTRAATKDSIWKWVLESPVKKQDIGQKYVYSDLGFIILQRLIEEMEGEPIDVCFSREVAKPLGLHQLVFLPKTKFAEDRVIPTERDSIFRKQMIKGFVHDPGAAMLGGVAGHAGLFGNAYELAVLMQLLLNKGSYNGMAWCKPSTVEVFTAAGNPSASRRGLGFDKPEPLASKPTPCSECADTASFGHSGFTGTFVWADPSTNLIYVFLSNRVHPTAANNKITQLSIRTGIQDVIYQIISQKSSCERAKN